MTSWVVVDHVSKAYNGKKAVDDLSFHIDRGEIFALLGPNGAGKSTLIRMMTGLIQPDAGQIRMNGERVLPFKKEVKRYFSFLPETMSLYPNLTAGETLHFFSRLQRISRNRCDEVLDVVGLLEVKDKKIGGFSKGMRQRLGLAVALLDKAPLLILDEPTSGLDPYWASRFKEIIRRKKRKGTSIFFASHDLYEVESLADRIAILNEGKLYYLGTVDDLKSKHPTEIRIQVRFEIPQDPDGLARELGVATFRRGDWIQLICRRDDKVRILRSLEKGGRKLADLHIHETTLEEIYRAISGGTPSPEMDKL
ncbi:MAG: ABC transporter ATP-binding protein [Planifilum fulgidum]